jgi:hypothetical protein
LENEAKILQQNSNKIKEIQDKDKNTQAIIAKLKIEIDQWKLQNSID